MAYEEFEIIKLVLFFTFLNSIFFVFNKNLSKVIGIYDVPDTKRKFHKGKPALLGGIYLAINLILFFFLSLINIFENDELFFFYDQFLFVSLLIFLIGLYDDKYHLKANLKLIFLCICVITFFNINSDLIIESLDFYTFNKTINLSSYSNFFTILCVLLFMNAFNMMDGTNLLAGTYSLIFIIYMTIFVNFSPLNITLIIFLFFYLYLNYKNLIFFGDSGSLLLSFIISIIIIHNHKHGRIYVEEIFVLMLIPGLDMFRLFISRIFNKKNPFNGDRNHLHHLLLNKYNNNQAILLYNCFFVINLILLNLIEQKTFLIILNVIFYSLIIYYLLNLKKN